MRNFENDLKSVDWDNILPQIYGITYNLEKIVYNLKRNLELAIEKIFEPLHNWEIEDGVEYDRKVNQIKLQRCPEPPCGFMPPQEITTQNGDKYFTIRSMWDLAYYLSEEYANNNCDPLIPLIGFNHPMLSYYLPKHSNQFNYERFNDDYYRQRVFYVEDNMQYIIVYDGNGIN